MNHDSGFAKLPYELNHLIAKESTQSGSLCTLAQVCRRTYAAANPMVYEQVGLSTLFTLALTERARLPLTNPHPASFVKCIDFDFVHGDTAYVLGGGPFGQSKIFRRKSSKRSMSLDIVTLQKLLTAAANNIIFYAPPKRLKRFLYRSNHIPLPDAFRNTNFSVLSAIDEVGLSCPFPSSTMRKSLAIVEAICGPALRNFDLYFSPDITPPDPQFVAKILRLVQRSCPNLTQFRFDSPDSLMPGRSPIQGILNDQTFTFPCLKELMMADHWESSLLFDECEPFFLRHPDVTSFEFFGQPDIPVSGLHSPVNPQILPKLSELRGLLHDVVILCSSGVRPVRSLSLTLLDDILPSEEILLESALRSTRTLRWFFIQDLRMANAGVPVGIRLPTLQTIIKACPHLTCFMCPVDVGESTFDISTMRTVYENISNNLSNLILLKLSFFIKGRPEAEGEDNSHAALFANHFQIFQSALRGRSIQMAQIRFVTLSKMRKPVIDADLYFVRPSLNGDWEPAQRWDRPEFGLNEIVD
ncbi:hypothetical protein GYMLUDRAFT_77137 [Collybiopsis luxurians FD-317 M1]|uniref:F-box domain-containing protein n=1 Tax=Collybiopsis luxurians FD-317 M1 TaxID=944289 RepID=A0A0D0C909_9AGAR|nr:hypothetical protein GYMLUDRAFT_77137 [Collybiopsis luxurians FD-317 M1]